MELSELAQPERIEMIKGAALVAAAWAGPPRCRRGRPVTGVAEAVATATPQPSSLDRIDDDKPGRLGPSRLHRFLGGAILPSGASPS